MSVLQVPLAATAIVNTWPNDVTAPFDRDAAEDGVALAEEIERVLRR